MTSLFIKILCIEITLTHPLETEKRDPRRLCLANMKELRNLMSCITYHCDCMKEFDVFGMHNAVHPHNPNTLLALTLLATLLSQPVMYPLFHLTQQRGKWILQLLMQNVIE